MKILYLYKTDDLRKALEDLIMEFYPYADYKATRDKTVIFTNSTVELQIRKLPLNLDVLRGKYFDYIYIEDAYAQISEREYNALTVLTHGQKGRVKVVTSLDRPALNVCIENLK